MIDIDALVSDFRSRVRDVRLPSPAVVAEQARAGVKQGQHSWVWIATGGAAAAATVAGLAVIFVNAKPAPNSGEAQPVGKIAFGTPRVDWGMVATVKVVRDPGTASTMADVTASITSEARRLDIPGMRIKQTGSDELTLSVPAAEAINQVKAFLTIPRLRIVDARAVLATGSSPNDLIGPGQRALRNGTPVRYLMAAAGRPPTLSTRFAPSLAAARAEQRSWHDPENAFVLAVPRGVTAVQWQTGVDKKGVPSSAFALVRDEPFASGTDITGFTVKDGTFKVTVSGRARKRYAGRTEPVRVFGLWTAYGRQANPAQATGLGELDPATGVVTFHANFGYDGRTLNFADPNLGARLALQRVQRYGDVQVLIWPKGPAVPSPISNGGAMQTAEPISLDAGGTTVTLRVWFTGSNAVVQSLIDARTGRSNSASSTCHLGLGAPALGPSCASDVIGTDTVVVGRVRHDVARIDAGLASGARIRSRVANGWYMLAWTPPAEAPTSTGARTLSKRFELPTVTAYDKDGKVLARQTPPG